MVEKHKKARANIIATLGPASQDLKMILNLAKAGVSVFRLNFSHGNHVQHLLNIKSIRIVEEKINRPLAIMADIQGPKIRIGTFVEKNIIIKQNDTFSFYKANVAGDKTGVTLPHPNLFNIFSKGEIILINDGRIKLQVKSCGREQIICNILVGGEISERKGVNIPGLIVPVNVLTEKDNKDLLFALQHNVDWIAVSFVQQAEDVRLVKEIVQNKALVLAKLEKPMAINHLEEILDVSDAVMVARGDLGVEVPPEKVPALQKKIIHSCHLKGKPVIVATQMLESMIDAPIPTRAEASDVATAIYDGADAVMLSAETAAGSYPIESVKIMESIILETEKDENYWLNMKNRQLLNDTSNNDIIARAAVNIAENSNCVVMVTFTSTGSTSIRASRVRSRIPILSLTPNLKTARRLALVWGIRCALTADISSMEEMNTKAQQEVYENKLGFIGDSVVVTAGVPFGIPGTTNLLRLTKVSRNEINLNSNDLML